MPRLGQILAATAFVAVSGACENPPRHDSLVDSRGATTMVIPSGAVMDVRAPREINSCDELGEYVRERMEETYFEIRIGNSVLIRDAINTGAQARESCEEERMREDCRVVEGKVRREVDAIVRQLEAPAGNAFVAVDAGKKAEEECLAGYGLAPEKEEAFASRSSDWDPNEPLDPAKIW